MHGDIVEQPLARAVLRHLAATRDADDPLRSFARAVIGGEATPRAAADFPWHSAALAEAAANAEQMTVEERAEYERAAGELAQRARAGELAERALAEDLAERASAGELAERVRAGDEERR